MSAVSAFAVEEEGPINVIIDKGTGYTKAGSILSDGNIWIIIAAALIVTIAIFSVIRIYKKSK